jgi:hypothetical protein
MVRDSEIQRFAAAADSHESSRRVQRGGLQGFPLDGGNILAEAPRLAALMLLFSRFSL